MIPNKDKKAEASFDLLILMGQMILKVTFYYFVSVKLKEGKILRSGCYVRQM